jgi:hypothetical protein
MQAAKKMIANAMAIAKRRVVIILPVLSNVLFCITMTIFTPQRHFYILIMQDGRMA